MFPFWNLAVWPVIEAAGARRVLEIGALRGETTVLMLDRLGPESEVHVIDPLPAFDPAEHERQFPGRYVFHRALSHEAIPRVPAVDVALIDGDHNWFTVFHELRMLSEVAREAGAPLPVMVMHDVCWPYGRRDLYYAPEQIPEEFRQPYEQRGMRPDKRKLLPHDGGLNREMYNAITEGGKRNGVMTGLDDFVAGYDRPLKVVVLPAYFGLAIVAEEERLARQPELAAVLARLESAQGKDAVIELAESVRIKDLIFQQNVFHHSNRLVAEASTRYLELLKGSLLGQHYFQDDLRLRYLAHCIQTGGSPDRDVLRDPGHHLKEDAAGLRNARRVGSAKDGPLGRISPMSTLHYADMGEVRLSHLESCLDKLRADGVGGDLVDCGTGRGGGAIFMRGYLDAHHVADVSVWVADTFRVEDEDPSDLLDLAADLSAVRQSFSQLGLLDDRVRFLQGPPSDTLPEAPIDGVALLRIGRGKWSATGALDLLYDKVAEGGVVIVDEYGAPGVQEAVDAFRERHGITDAMERIDWLAASWRKVAPAGEPSAAPPPEALPSQAATSGGANRAPLAAPAPVEAKDLSVVVVVYDMKREAPRTLHSLSRAYQRGVEDLDYEVIVVENGSAPEEKLGEELVRSFGPNFRYVDLGDQATPSPTTALNHGAALASGNVIAFMIDGAHVLTPGVLQWGMTGLEAYEPAIVTTQQWYVGPGQQGDTMHGGYDEGYEDRLFEGVQWPDDGYRLFDIGHFIGDRDWLDGLWESNCIFVPRKLLQQVGCFDDSFSMPGGGYANLELFERLGHAPDHRMVTILGEGSFHQTHGGTTTNRSDADDRRNRIVSYAQHYAELRGRSFKGPGRTMHYVGTMHTSALRTRGRRMTGRAFLDVSKKVTTGEDGRPTVPTPVPDDLKLNFIEAFWRSFAWRETEWLGTKVDKAPTDLFAYQELLASVRPDWIIETGTGNGGRALFLASICELLGTGSVISVDGAKRGDRPEHPRLTYVTGVPHEPETVERVRALTGQSPRGLVILGTVGPQRRMVREFEAFEPFVPVGSYVVMEETIVNGHPVWPGFGPGPGEAVQRVLVKHSGFAVDPTFEKYSVTFNPGGYLKRIK